jgi:plastocyanin
MLLLATLTLTLAAYVLAADTTLTPVSIDIDIAGYAQDRVYHTVEVGIQNSPLFTPNQINANIGDRIVFNFHGMNHTLTQSSLDTPCIPAASFDSGFNQFNPDDDQEVSLTLTVNTLDPQWFFCKQMNHCHAGMVFALNPGADMELFLNNAKREVSSTIPLPTETIPGPNGPTSQMGISPHTRSSTSAIAFETSSQGPIIIPVYPGTMSSSSRSTMITITPSADSMLNLATTSALSTTTITLTVGCTQSPTAVSVRRDVPVSNGSGTTSAFTITMLLSLMAIMCVFD